VPALLAPDLDKAADLARQEKAKGTRRAYRTDFANAGLKGLRDRALLLLGFAGCRARPRTPERLILTHPWRGKTDQEGNIRVGVRKPRPR
jgi:hypothetical protein